MSTVTEPEREVDVLLENSLTSLASQVALRQVNPF
jgi:hypothetical protein